MKKIFYPFLGFLSCSIVGYVVYLFIFGYIGFLPSISGNGTFLLIFPLIFGSIGAWQGYKLAKANYRLKGWQIFILSVIFICFSIFLIWVWQAIGGLGDALKDF